MQPPHLPRLFRLFLLTLFAATGALPPTAHAQQAGGPLRFNGPAEQPTTRPTTRPAPTPEEQHRRRLASLSRRAIHLIRSERYAEAERTLAEAILMAPDHSTNLYNMACVKALRGLADESIDYLERAALAGFTDFVHIDRDPDLNPLRALPRYLDLIARKGEFQRRAADKVVEWLKKEFGEGYLYEIDEANKLIFATNTDRQTLNALRTTLVRQARSQWRTLFAHKPDHYISVVVPSAEDYRKIVRQPGVGGFYNHENRILIARQLGQVMIHEFTHALHNADLDYLGIHPPIWLAEGIGAMFEAAQFDENDELVPADNFRLRDMHFAARRNRLIPLDRLFSMSQKDFVANPTVNLTYGQAGSVCLYLHELGLLRKFHDTFKETHDQDPTGRLALKTVTEKDLDVFESEWKAWMLARDPVRMNTGPQGVFLGVRFTDVNDGLMISFAMPNGSAHSAGIRAGDVLIGVNEHDVRDQRSLFPLLSAFKPGDQVTMKVRRGAEYREFLVTLNGREGSVQRMTRPNAPPPPVDSRPGAVR